jgi:sugar lactone lactonase YvrE
LYVLHGTLRRYPPGGGRATLLAGDTEPGYVDGMGAKARFNHPTGLAVDAQGNVFVADRGNHLIRRVSPQGEVTTVAGQPGLHKVPPTGKNFTERYYGPDNISELGDYP